MIRKTCRATECSTTKRHNVVCFAAAKGIPRCPDGVLRRKASTFMSTAAIENALWRSPAAAPAGAQLRVRAHTLARPRGAFLAAELTLLAVAVLQTAWGRHGLETPTMFACCAVFFHINSLDKSIVSSKASQFWIDLVESLLL